MNEIYKDIQSILALSDIHPADCIKINNLIVELIKENQELKLELSGYRQAILEDKDMLGLKEESEELKNQLEEKENIACNWKDSCLENAGKIEILENQQKEFIKYLEKRYKDITSVIGSYGSNTDMLYGKKDILEEIFQEFKSIIGDDK